MPLPAPEDRDSLYQQLSDADDLCSDLLIDSLAGFPIRTHKANPHYRWKGWKGKEVLAIVQTWLRRIQEAAGDKHVAEEGAKNKDGRKADGGKKEGRDGKRPSKSKTHGKQHAVKHGTDPMAHALEEACLSLLVLNAEKDHDAPALRRWLRAHCLQDDRAIAPTTTATPRSVNAQGALVSRRRDAVTPAKRSKVSFPELSLASRSWLGSHLPRAQTNPRLYTEFMAHLSRYLHMYHPDAGFELSETRRFSSTGKAEACVIATRDHPYYPGARLPFLCGAVADLTTEQEAALAAAGPGGDQRDFSVFQHERTGVCRLFLGPARFVNHDCSPNVAFTSMGPNLVCFRVLRGIKLGEEILTSYGDNYFGPNNKDCLCCTCMKKRDRLAKGRETPEMATVGKRLRQPPRPFAPMVTWSRTSAGLPSGSQATTADGVLGTGDLSTCAMAAMALPNPPPDPNQSLTAREIEARFQVCTPSPRCTPLPSNAPSPNADATGAGAVASGAAHALKCDICEGYRQEPIFYKWLQYDDAYRRLCEACYRHYLVYDLPWPHRHALPDAGSVTLQRGKKVDEAAAVAAWRERMRAALSINGDKAMQAHRRSIQTALSCKGAVAVFVNPEDHPSDAQPTPKAGKKKRGSASASADADLQPWWVGLVVPEDEQETHMPEPTANELLVKLFECKDTYVTLPIKDLRLFHPSLEPFISFARSPIYGQRFLKDPSVVAAISFLEQGRPRQEKWCWGMWSSGSRQEEQYIKNLAGALAPEQYPPIQHTSTPLYRDGDTVYLVERAYGEKRRVKLIRHRVLEGDVEYLCSVEGWGRSHKKYFSQTLFMPIEIRYTDALIHELVWGKERDEAVEAASGVIEKTQVSMSNDRKKRAKLEIEFTEPPTPSSQPSMIKILADQKGFKMGRIGQERVSILDEVEE